VDSRIRPVWRYRMRKSGLAPVAAQLAVPVALGLLVGGVLSYQAGSSNNAVIPRPLGAVTIPTPSFVKPSAQHGAVNNLPTGGWIKPSASLEPSATHTVRPTPAANASGG
jgi:hypothetical protein